MSDTSFWLKDLTVLYRNENYLDFFPVKGMNKIEILNALTRLCIYCFVLLLILKYEYQYVSIPLIGIVFIVFIYVLHSKESFKEFDKDEIKEEKINEPEEIKSYDDHKKFVEGICRKPTKNNPFMNVLVSDYGNTNDPVSCNPELTGIKEKIESSFQDNLYRSVDDVWNRENSQRQFYTMPVDTVPNKQTEFAKWLYNTPYSCKSDQMYCLQYEDLRFTKR
jgi:hypothetical protein